MAGASIQVDDILIRAALAQLQGRAGDLGPAFEEIGAMLVSSVIHRFEHGIAPDGNPWPVSGRAQAEGGKTLVDSARLMQSITYQAGDGEVSVGTNVVYAAIHQFGGRIEAKSGRALTFPLPGGGWATVKAVAMPARPFLGVNDDDRQGILDILGDYLMEGLQ
ncbi:phage virion morphogenesis protein [Telmatospirillum sp. J64-1]|uniref:phage virion morphogenesis protein n=1 Tax=Telmatospirillum sp. J64-1 TaxID=2502183 RepID=UPI00115EE921|nr:phage virion morphogenesis protein [Telmatospirillum sp. J64-1]